LKNSNLCDHNSPTSQTDRRTDRQTTCDRNTALCTKVHRAVITKYLTCRTLVTVGLRIICRSYYVSKLYMPNYGYIFLHFVVYS